MSAVRKLNDQILMEPETKARKWKKYFSNLLNCAIPDNLIVDNLITLLYQRTEPHGENLNPEEMEAAILFLRKLENPSQDETATRLNTEEKNYTKPSTRYVKRSGTKSKCRRIEMKQSRNYTPCKKGDITDCNNYRNSPLEFGT